MNRMKLYGKFSGSKTYKSFSVILHKVSIWISIHQRVTTLKHEWKKVGQHKIHHHLYHYSNHHHPDHRRRDRRVIVVTTTTTTTTTTTITTTTITTTTTTTTITTTITIIIIIIIAIILSPSNSFPERTWERGCYHHLHHQRHYH